MYSDFFSCDKSALLSRANLLIKKNNILTIFSSIFLVVSFLSDISWIHHHNIYYEHFFESGLNIFVYNLCRFIFVFFLLWVIYAAGNFFTSIFISQLRARYSLVERLILGFVTGFAFWHVLLLILGLSNLYYPSVMIYLCVVILILSGNNFRQIVYEAGDTLIDCFNSKWAIEGKTFLILTLALCWLFVTKVLAPGGSGDFFTHYYYYYIEVLKNHGLAPNDVWYHFFYSKGAGIQFLSMLLTDPSGLQMAPFCCVFIATLAITSLAFSLAPGSFWPLSCSLLYLLYTIFFSEFQKTHDETSALIVLLIWALCLFGTSFDKWKRPAFIALCSIIVSGAILTQALAI